MKFLISMMLVASALALSVRAQVANQANPGTTHFEKSGLAFDFPADWKLTDFSAGDLQRITIASTDGAAQIGIVAGIGGDDFCDFQTAGQRTINNMLGPIATNINAARPLQTTPVKTHVGAQEIDGVQIRGSRNNRPVTCEVYWLRLNVHLVTLAYLRSDDDARGQSAWESLRATLTLATAVVDAASAHAGVPKDPNVLNGRALHLGQPPYPATARQAHATGTVLVQVVIDEAGDVIFARAFGGHPLLHAVSEAAARESKFSPTKLCDVPVRITGLIQYRFTVQ